MDGAALGGLTLQKLADDYGLTDEADQKKILYTLKGAQKKDNMQGNVNHWAQFAMCAPRPPPAARRPPLAAGVGACAACYSS